MSFDSKLAEEVLLGEHEGCGKGRKWQDIGELHLELSRLTMVREEEERKEGYKDSAILVGSNQRVAATGSDVIIVMASSNATSAGASAQYFPVHSMHRLCNHTAY